MTFGQLENYYLDQINDLLNSILIGPHIANTGCHGRCRLSTWMETIFCNHLAHSQYSQHFPNPKLNPIKINEIDTPAVNLDKFLRISCWKKYNHVGKLFSCVTKVKQIMFCFHSMKISRCNERNCQPHYRSYSFSRF